MNYYEEKSIWIIDKLIPDFKLSLDDACAITGNLGHESMGFKALQEKKPLIPGSAGGYGWAQWTGPRRRAYEAYCKRNNLDPASDKANYGYLFIELTTTEKSAIPAVKNAKTLEAKVKAFELNFERAGIKHYDSRLKYAQMAMRAYQQRKIAPEITKIEELPKAPVQTPIDNSVPKGAWSRFWSSLSARLRK